MQFDLAITVRIDSLDKCRFYVQIKWERTLFVRV